MKRHIYVSFILLLTFPFLSIAQTPIPLYEEGKVPNSTPTTMLADSFYFRNPSTGTDTMIIIPRTFMPTLTVFPPRGKSNGVGIIVCPGGAYYKVSDELEGFPTAGKLADAGFTAFVLHYRLPHSDMMVNKEIAPIQDAQSAIRYVREHAKKYNIDPRRLGILGYSAGGHLVSTAGTHFNHAYIDNPGGTNLRPDFMILSSPVISFADSLTHKLTRKNLIGPDITPEKIFDYSNELQITEQTPPTFIVHAMDDPVVKIDNSLYFAAALEQHHVPVKLFIYATGGHTYGILHDNAAVKWIDECIKWIKKQENISN